MEKKLINENMVKDMVSKLLSEDMSKVSRQDFSRVQFKIEELQNSLNETVKELRKLSDSIPTGLKGVTNARIGGISSNLSGAQKLLAQLKDKIRTYKKTLYSQSLEEKKK
jgi:hypothetical protein